MVPTQPPTQWVPGALSLVVKRSGHEAAHSHPSSAAVKYRRSYNSAPPIRLHGVVLRSKSTGTTLTFRYGTDEILCKAKVK
jgi:hypothetical protein